MATSHVCRSRFFAAWRGAELRRGASGGNRRLKATLTSFHGTAPGFARRKKAIEKSSSESYSGRSEVRWQEEFEGRERETLRIAGKTGEVAALGMAPTLPSGRFILIVGGTMFLLPKDGRLFNRERFREAKVSGIGLGDTVGESEELLDEAVDEEEWYGEEGRSRKREYGSILSFLETGDFFEEGSGGGYRS